nr:hypothetical protein CFP56_76489 [Quercus suber]
MVAVVVVAVLIDGQHARAPPDTHHDTVRSATDRTICGTSQRHRHDRDRWGVSGPFCTDGDLISTRRMSPAADVKRSHLAKRRAAVYRARGVKAPLDESRDASPYLRYYRIYRPWL